MNYHYKSQRHPGCRELDKRPRPETDRVMTEVISKKASPDPSQPQPGQPNYAPSDYETRKQVVLAANSSQPLRWWYTQHDEHPAWHPQEKECLLPSMLQLVTAHLEGSPCSSSLFDPCASIRANVCSILGSLKHALFASACYPYAPSAPAADLPPAYVPEPLCHDVWPWAFTLAGSYRPAGAEEGELWDRPCMLARCSRSLPRLLHRSPDGYVKVQLGLLKEPGHDWQPVHEYCLAALTRTLQTGKGPTTTRNLVQW